jgi:hypothetical protein
VRTKAPARLDVGRQLEMLQDDIEDDHEEMGYRLDVLNTEYYI